MDQCRVLLRLPLASVPVLAGAPPSHAVDHGQGVAGPC